MTTKSNPPAPIRGVTDEPEEFGLNAHDTGSEPVRRPCSCVEADLLWAIFSGEAPPPDTAGMRALLDLAEAIALRKLAAIRPLLAVSDMDASITNRYVERTKITSVMDCGVCGQATEVVHPIEPWQFDLLPDTTWVRCDRCSTASLEARQGAA